MTHDNWAVPLADVRFSEEEVEAVADVYRAGWLSQGPRVAEFERAFAEFVSSSHAIALSSGTAALHLALVGAGIKDGDEVIVPSLTFAATAAAVVESGARPVLADIAGPEWPWLSTSAVEMAIGPRTRAIINVAYGGHPGEATALRELSDANGLTLIEDATHAPGARVSGRAVGTLGHAGAFSFFANKNLPLGEGGMLVTDDPELAERVRLLRSHGLSRGTWERHHRLDVSGYDVLMPGFNYRLDEPRAALGTVLLARLEADNGRRAQLAERYAGALTSIDGINGVIESAPGVRCAWHIYPVLLEHASRRDALADRLRAAGVQTTVHYPPLHGTRGFAAFSDTPLPNTERYAGRTLTLPLFPHMSEEQQLLVIASIRACFP